MSMHDVSIEFRGKASVSPCFSFHPQSPRVVRCIPSVSQAPGEGTRPTALARVFPLFPLPSPLSALFLALALVCLAFSAAAQPGIQRLYSFGIANQSGTGPEGPLVRASDGFFYGTAAYGGAYGNGAVFKIGTNGTGYVVVHTFGSVPGDGTIPSAGVIQGTDGALYGIAQNGGSSNGGTVFRVNPDGSGFALLHTFNTNAAAADGFYPICTLIQGRDGFLYGTTYGGGTSGNGTVFKIATNGTGYAILHHFGSIAGDGQNPFAGLIQGVDGALYGTTDVGGSAGLGVIFVVNPDGSGFNLLHNFLGTPTDAGVPRASLLQGNDGVLYGTSYWGGTNGNSGTLFRVNTNGTGYVLLHSFSAGSDGIDLQTPLMQGMDGMLYGTSSYGGTNSGGAVFKIATDGSGFTVVYSFTGYPDGANPYSGLIQLPNGTLYGTTEAGGRSSSGCLFTINTNGTGYATLYSFSETGGDGDNPIAPLLQAADGVLYGTTENGGTEGVGTVFRINTNGTSYAVLYSFLQNNSDGQSPTAPLIQGQDGMLYGVTYYGGTNASHSGTVFKISTNGTGYALLYQFGATSNDGRNPVALLQGSDGVLYGVAQAGGGPHFGGSVFKLNTNGTGYSTIYSFDLNGTMRDGYSPAGLTQGRDGKLYGTVTGGGTNNRGCVFVLNTNGTGYSQVYAFLSAGPDARSPQAGVIQAADGALYGTTASGGTSNLGAVFRVNTDGTGYAVLHSFTQTGDGVQPYGPLIQGSDGILYGTTQSGGSANVGTIFGLNTSGTQYVVWANSFDTAPGHANTPGYGLVQGRDGQLYGVSQAGGDLEFGTVFSFVTIPSIQRQPTNIAAYPLATATFSVQVGSFIPLSYQWLFNSTPVAGAMSSSLQVLVTPAQVGGYSAIASNIYGAVTSSVATLTMLAPTQALQTVVLHSFGAAPGDGQWPMAGLMQATNGLLFGTTYGGGPLFGNGTVFFLNTNGSGYAMCSQFSGLSGDAARPEAAVIQGTDGAIYGTTVAGGAYGYGAVYRIQNPTGTSARDLIHSFGGSERGDGSQSYAPLVQLSDGFLYGTTVLDGASGYGTLFRLSTDGASYSLRNSFSAASGGGIHPYGGLMQGADGALYGTTYSGGASGYGTVFRLANPASGPAPQWLHSFTNISAGDGAYPYAGLAQSSDGTLYGTTWSGGSVGVASVGTVFGLNADGSGYAVRVSFSVTNPSAGNPYSGVVVGNDGALYGTTYGGGAAGYGTVFRVRNPAGAPVLEYLHSFSNTNGDGAYPVGGLLQAADGTFFGTTSSGGAAGEGTVYEFAFDPRIATQPTNLFVAAGSTVTFNVAAAGTGPFSYQWLFNGNPLSGATSATLTLNNVTTNQAGVYSVVVFGAAGTVTSQGASLGVVGRPVFTSVTRLGDGNVRLMLNVVPNANYNIQSSSNLVSWVTATNVFATSATMQVTDLSATNSPRRFYRAVWGP